MRHAPAYVNHESDSAKVAAQVEQFLAKRLLPRRIGLDLRQTIECCSELLLGSSALSLQCQFLTLQISGSSFQKDDSLTLVQRPNDRGRPLGVGRDAVRCGGILCA
ncbi:MAG: hypothetical protein KDA61_15810, partial [Planctomycetales bacterium]|nr:hypothetical protein [Planctomycetales bacterium]